MLIWYETSFHTNRKKSRIPSCTGCSRNTSSIQRDSSTTTLRCNSSRHSTTVPNEGQTSVFSSSPSWLVDNNFSTITLLWCLKSKLETHQGLLQTLERLPSVRRIHLVYQRKASKTRHSNLRWPLDRHHWRSSYVQGRHYHYLLP